MQINLLLPLQNRIKNYAHPEAKLTILLTSSVKIQVLKKERKKKTALSVKEWAK